MKNRFTLIMTFCFSISLCFAQTKKVDAILDFTKNEEGQVVITSKALNLSKKPQSFAYSMQLMKSDSGNKSNSVQSGDFTILPGETTALSTIQINLSTKAEFEISLTIYDDKNIYDEQILKSDDAFFTAYKKLAVTPNKNPKSQSITKIDNTEKAQPQKHANQSDVIEIGGLIIDDTRSKIGRDFYDVFYRKWADPGGGAFSITIKELPARGRASNVAIEVDGNVVFQRMVQPRQEIIELLADHSVAIVKNYLSKKKALNKELESPDQQGSGIF